MSRIFDALGASASPEPNRELNGRRISSRLRGVKRLLCGKGALRLPQCITNCRLWTPPLAKLEPSRSATRAWIENRQTALVFVLHASLNLCAVAAGFLALALACNVTSAAAAETISAAFAVVAFDNPQPSDDLFARSWPGLIEANNRDSAKLFPGLKPPPGHNAALSLAVARLAIPGGEAVLSIYTGPLPRCQGAGSLRGTGAVALPCPARLTIRRERSFRTVDIGFVCRVAPVTSSSRTLATFDADANVIRLSAEVDGRPVETAGDNVPCGRAIPLN